MSQQKFTTVLWDLDGTILDSSPGVFESFRHTLATLGLGEITDEQLKPFMGPPLEYTFGTLLGHSPEMVSKCLETYREYYLHMGGALNANVYPGVLETLAKSQAAGITNSLATSKAERGAKLTGEHFGFIQYFDVLGTASNDSSRLSKTAVLKYAFEELQKIGADLSRVILIGDRIHDIEGARELGIPVALVKWGFGTEEEWHQADYVVETPAELQELLGL